MRPIVELTDEEIATAFAVAAARTKLHVAAGNDYRYSDGSSEFKSAQGLLGEIAYGKFLDVPIDLSTDGVPERGGGVDFTYKGIRYDAKTVRAGYDQIMCLPRENPRVQAYAFARLPDLARDAPVHQSNLRRVELVGRCRADILRAPANLKRLPWGEMYVLHESLLAQWPVPAVVCEIDLDFVERYERTGRATWGQRW